MFTDLYSRFRILQPNCTGLLANPITFRDSKVQIKISKLFSSRNYELEENHLKIEFANTVKSLKLDFDDFKPNKDTLKLTTKNSLNKDKFYESIFRYEIYLSLFNIKLNVTYNDPLCPRFQVKEFIESYSTAENETKLPNERKIFKLRCLSCNQSLTKLNFEQNTEYFTF
jgi:hypothetical protein